MSEFPAQENLREVLRVPSWTPEKQHSESDFARAAEEMLVTGRQAFMKCLAELSPIVQVALRYVHDSVMEGAGISIKDFCAKNGMNALISRWQGHIFPSPAYENGGIHEAIMEYENNVFFDILAEDLARRDMNDAPIDESNYAELAHRIEAYINEFEENGTDNILVDIDTTI